MIIQFSRTEVSISQILSDSCSTKAIFINSFFSSSRFSIVSMDVFVTLGWLEAL